MKTYIKKTNDKFNLYLTIGSGKDRVRKSLKIKSTNSDEITFISNKLNEYILNNTLETEEDFYNHFKVLNINSILEVISNKEENIFFIDYISKIINYKHNMKSITDITYSTYMNIINNHFSNFFKGMRIKNLNKSILNDYFLSKSNLSQGTLKRHLSLIRIAVSNAIDEDLLNKDITANIILPKNKIQKKEIYTTEDVYVLLDTLKKSNKKELYIQVLLASMLGLRNSEVLGLTWEAIDLKNNKIQIKRITTKDKNNNIVLEDRTKTKSSYREIEMPKEITKELLEYKTKTYFNPLNGNKLLFHKKGKPIFESKLSEDFSRFINNNNLKKTTIHGLRHYFASKLINNNVPVTLVSSLLGHSNTNITTSVYAHLIDLKNETSGNMLSEIMFG